MTNFPHEAIANVSLCGAIIAAHPSLAALLGQSPETLQGQSFLQLFAPEDQQGVQRCINLLAKQQSWHLTLRVHLSANRDSSRELRLILPEPSASYFVATLAPIETGASAPAEILPPSMPELAYSAYLASLQTMAGGIAHEINNPLTIIEGLTRRLLHRDADDPMSELSLQRILESVRRIAKVVKGLQYFAGEVERSQSADTLLSDIIEAALSSAKDAIQNQQIALRVVLAEPDLTLLCRPEHIAQALLCLLNNAIDAVSGVEERWIEIKISADSYQISIAITNSGPPISEAIRERMAQPFFTTKDIGQGSGLGLTITEAIARAHGGALQFDLKASATSFVLHFPRSLSELHNEIKKTA